MANLRDNFTAYYYDPYAKPVTSIPPTKQENVNKDDIIVYHDPGSYGGDTNIDNDPYNQIIITLPPDFSPNNNEIPPGSVTAIAGISYPIISIMYGNNNNPEKIIDQKHIISCKIDIEDLLPKIELDILYNSNEEMSSFNNNLEISKHIKVIITPPGERSADRKKKFYFKITDYEQPTTYIPGFESKYRFKYYGIYDLITLNEQTLSETTIYGELGFNCDNEKCTPYISSVLKSKTDELPQTLNIKYKTKNNKDLVALVQKFLLINDFLKNNKNSKAKYCLTKGRRRKRQNTYEPTGYFCLATYNAIKAWQIELKKTNNSITVDGIIGQQSWPIILEAMSQRDDDYGKLAKTYYQKAVEHTIDADYAVGAETTTLNETPPSDNQTINTSNDQADVSSNNQTVKPINNNTQIVDNLQLYNKRQILTSISNKIDAISKTHDSLPTLKTDNDKPGTIKYLLSYNNKNKPKNKKFKDEDIKSCILIIKHLLIQFNQIDANNLSNDITYDDKLKDGVKRLQKTVLGFSENDADGIVGKNTWGAIKNKINEEKTALNQILNQYSINTQQSQDSTNTSTNTTNGTTSDTTQLADPKAPRKLNTWAALHALAKEYGFGYAATPDVISIQDFETSIVTPTKLIDFIQNRLNCGGTNNIEILDGWFDEYCTLNVCNIGKLLFNQYYAVNLDNLTMNINTPMLTDNKPYDPKNVTYAEVTRILTNYSTISSSVINKNGATGYDASQLTIEHYWAGAIEIPQITPQQILLENTGDVPPEEQTNGAFKIVSKGNTDKIASNEGGTLQERDLPARALAAQDRLEEIEKNKENQMKDTYVPPVVTPVTPTQTVTPQTVTSQTTTLQERDLGVRALAAQERLEDIEHKKTEQMKDTYVPPVVKPVTPQTTTENGAVPSKTNSTNTTVTKVSYKVFDAKSLANGRYLRKGSTGDNVRLVQTLLNISVTGKYDDKTYNAVKSYQEAHNLKQDGYVGVQTWLSMLQVYNPQTIQAPEATTSTNAKNTFAKFVNNIEQDSPKVRIIRNTNPDYNPGYQFELKKNAITNLCSRQNLLVRLQNINYSLARGKMIGVMLFANNTDKKQEIIRQLKKMGISLDATYFNADHQLPLFDLSGIYYINKITYVYDPHLLYTNIIPGMDDKLERKNTNNGNSIYMYLELIPQKTYNNDNNSFMNSGVFKSYIEELKQAQKEQEKQKANDEKNKDKDNSTKGSQEENKYTGEKYTYYDPVLAHAKQDNTPK